MSRTVKFGGNEVKLIGTEIKVGDRAPNFKAVNNDLSEYTFYKATEGKVKVISIAPSIDTGICSLQTIRFNQEASKYSGSLDIVTVTVDLPFAQGRYCAAEGIDNIKVVSDHKDLDFGEKYGFAIEAFRLLARGIVVVDADNIVRYVEYVEEVGTHPDYDKALKVIDELI